MTEHATHFIDPVMFRSLTHEKVAVDLFDDPTDPIHHISLAEEADAFVIAPCTANVLAKLANGIADDLLTTTALACTAPLVLAPAMNVHMYEAAATRYNIGKLGIRGAVFVEADEGYLACGDVGRGRLADPAAIVARTLEVLGVKQDLEGKHVMITAGPTVGPIDPVRYISNRSSGKTGYAIARAARRRGADVTRDRRPVSFHLSDNRVSYQFRTLGCCRLAKRRSFRRYRVVLRGVAICVRRMRRTISWRSRCLRRHHHRSGGYPCRARGRRCIGLWWASLPETDNVIANTPRRSL